MHVTCGEILSWQSFVFPDFAVSISRAPVPACSSAPGQVQLTCSSEWAGVTTEPKNGGSPHQSLVPLQLRRGWDRWTLSWLEPPLGMSWGLASPRAAAGVGSVPAQLRVGWQLLPLLKSSQCFAQLCSYLLVQVVTTYLVPRVFLSRPHPLKR